jgi:hypothetical protein
MRWEWPGYFSLDVPEGWEVQQSQGLVDIVPPSGTGSATISVVWRSSEAPAGKAAAELLLRDFAQKQGTDEFGEISEVSSNTLRGDFRAAGLLWDVLVTVADDLVIRCSYCHSGEDKSTRELALRMLESVRLDGKAGHATATTGPKLVH